MLSEVYIPETITVHLGPPNSDAENVSIPFTNYLKNVASSEIYPTWPDAALRANIYAIISFALNRIFTEWYPSRGYNFDITNSTQYDQKYIHGRDIFENISVIVDEIFNTYIRRQGFIEPLFAAFCDGYNVVCDGLSQWGTVDLAQQGLGAFDILQHYYGDDIELVEAPVRMRTPSYPGKPLKLGDASNDVATIQIQLNRISRNYPAIPKIPGITGIYDGFTEAAVKEFQSIFNLPVTGIVDQATWYKIAYIYTSVTHLAELISEGLTIKELRTPFSKTLQFGLQAPEVEVLQYMLSVIGSYYSALSCLKDLPATGYFGEKTENAVKEFQKVFGFPQTGIVDLPLWNKINEAYIGIVESVPFDLVNLIPLFQGDILTEGMRGNAIKRLQEYLSFISQTYPDIPPVEPTGYFGPQTKASVIAFQNHFGIPPRGVVASITWDKVASVYSDLKYGMDRRVQQFPGFTIT